MKDRDGQARQVETNVVVRDDACVTREIRQRAMSDGGTSCLRYWIQIEISRVGV